MRIDLKNNLVPWKMWVPLCTRIYVKSQWGGRGGGGDFFGDNYRAVPNNRIFKYSIDGLNIRLVFSGSNIPRKKNAASTQKRRSFCWICIFLLVIKIILSSTFGRHLASLSYSQCCLCDVGQAMSGLILLMYQVSSQVQWLPFMFWPSQTVVSIPTMGLSITV